MGLLAGATIVAVFLRMLVYYFTVREEKHTRTKSVTFVSIICTQFVTLFQMLGVLDTLSVAWPGPFAIILETGSLLNFRLEVLSVGCIVTAPPLYRYVGNAFFFAVLTADMVVIHFVRVLVFLSTPVERSLG